MLVLILILEINRMILNFFNDTNLRFDVKGTVIPKEFRNEINAIIENPQPMIDFFLSKAKYRCFVVFTRTDYLLFIILSKNKKGRCICVVIGNLKNRSIN